MPGAGVHLRAAERAARAGQRALPDAVGEVQAGGEPLRQREGKTVHHVEFRVLPAEVTYRPAAATPWPKTYGPQTARVVGPQGSRFTPTATGASR